MRISAEKPQDRQPSEPAIRNDIPLFLLKVGGSQIRIMFKETFYNSFSKRASGTDPGGGKEYVPP